MTMQPSEQNLIQHAQAGNLDAFNQLVLRYQDGLYRYAMSLTNDPDLADDVTQESFVKAFQNIKSLYGDSLRVWLFKIATNTARDLARRKARHPLVALYPVNENGEEVESAEWLFDPSPSVEETVQMHEASARLHNLLDELPEVHRSILTLIDLHEMDYAEAADVLNVPIGTVKSRLARARMQMKLKLQGNPTSLMPSNGFQALAI